MKFSVSSTATTCSSLLFGLLAISNTIERTTGLEVGDVVCVEGNIMDFFCIERGTLLDRSDVRTLEGPFEHSVHCLIDVRSCVNSPFEVLLDPTEDGQLFARGWRISDNTQQLVINDASRARSQDGFRVGYRAALNATVIDLGSSTTPPTIEVHDVAHSNLNGLSEDPCGEFFGTVDIIEKIENKTDGDPNATSPFGRITDVDSSESNFRMKALAHGSCMLIGWGFLLPTGVISAKLFKHRPNALWFKIHRGCQITGLCIAIIGWIIALMNFTALQDKGFNNHRHAVLGMITMFLGIFQPLNAFIRPHPPEDGESKPLARTIWEIIHKCTGYTACLLAVATIGLGTTLIPALEGRAFQFAYGIGCGLLFISMITYMCIDKKNYPQDESNKPEQAKTKDIEEVN